MKDAIEERISREAVETVKKYIDGSLRDRLGLKPNALLFGLSHALHLLEAGHVDDALRMCAGLVAIDPGNVRHLAGLANCAIAAGQPDLAIRAAAMIMIREPRNPLGYYFSGLGCIGINHMQEAMEDLADAVRLAEAEGNDELARTASTMLSRLKLN